MKDNRIRLGIIGCGLMGREAASAVARWCHLTDVEFAPEIVAVCDARRENMEWFTKHFPTVKHTCTDYRRLVENREVDAVYCAVPHNLQREIYVAAVEAGKHLLGEKPFGIDREANAAILAAARAHPEAIVRSSSEFPFFPAVQRIAGALREERFGRIIEVECGFLHSSDMDPGKPLNWKRIKATNGEYGVMGDLGLHVFHLPLRAGWIPRNVRAILSDIVTARPDATGKLTACDTWDNATLLVECEAQGHAFPLTARMQRIAPGETNTWYLAIKGTRFSARFSTRRPKTLETLSYEPGGAQRWESEDIGYESLYRTVTGRIFEFGFSDAVQQMLAAFFEEAVKGAGKVAFSCATPEETRISHEVFTAALRSHESKQVVAV